MTKKKKTGKKKKRDQHRRNRSLRYLPILALFLLTLNTRASTSTATMKDERIGSVSFPPM